MMIFVSHESSITYSSLQVLLDSTHDDVLIKPSCHAGVPVIKPVILL